MTKLDIKGSKRLMLLCSAAYFTSYLTRINFAAVIVAIIQAGDIDKSLAGAVTTIGFITYGVGQLLSGWLGDRINPKLLMFGGFIVTAMMNMLIPFCPNGYYMCVVWGFNGLAQAFMWPPMVKIMKTAMDDDCYNKGCIVVSWGSTIATILIYLIAPLIISQWSWRAVFRINACVALVMSVVWIFAISAIEKSSGLSYVLVSGKDKKEKSSFSVNIILLASVMLAIMLQGCLRDGITTWIPTYVTEVFHLDSGVSILSGVIIPLLGLASYQLASFLYNKMGKKPYHCAGLLFTVAAVCLLILRLFSNLSVIFSVALAGVAVASMHGVNLVLICFLPAMLAGDGNMSGLSGALNFTTYIGSAISTYGFAVLSESFGWNGTLVSWVAIAVLGTGMCALCAIKNKNIDKIS